MPRIRTTLVPEPMLKTSEVAALFGVTRTTVLKWAAEGMIRSVRPAKNGHHRFPESEVRALLNRQQVPPRSANPVPV